MIDRRAIGATTRDAAMTVAFTTVASMAVACMTVACMTVAFMTVASTSGGRITDARSTGAKRAPDITANCGPIAAFAMAGVVTPMAADREAGMVISVRATASFTIIRATILSDGSS